MPDPNVFHVTPDHAGKTLLAVLRIAVPGESWSKLRQRLERSRVALNGAVCLDEARRLNAGDMIRLHDKSLTVPQSRHVRICYMDTHLLVVEKPSGMMTQRRPEEANWSAEKKARQPTLEETVAELVAQRQRAENSRFRGSRLRIVHRLDRDTSGLLVIARTDAAEESLVGQFRRHTAHRVYWAIVHGQPDEETIESNLVRDRGDGRRGSVNNPKLGQRAVTHVRPLESLGLFSLVECQLETGRTNQIRIHLAERGHLVCGDQKYCQPYAAERIEDRSGAPRLALHAAELGFVHPQSNEEMGFRMPFPDDLAQFLDRLRSYRNRAGDVSWR